MFDLEDASSRHQTHWRYEPAKAGGGVPMDGATHWVRPLRVWATTVVPLAPIILMVMQMTCTPYSLLSPGTYRFGGIAEVVGITGHPYSPSKGESLSTFTFEV